MTQGTARFQGLPGVQQIVAFISSRSGVGKSTLCVNLAIALVEKGKKIGLLDADVEDPALLALMGIQDKPESKDGRIIPLEEYGVKVIPLEALLQEAQLEAFLIRERLLEVAWGELDCLLVDLPPGWGRTTCTIAQAIPLTGTVLIMTPQQAAMTSLGKGVELFRQLHIQVLGIIENMSFLLCPYCLKGIEVFGHGVGRMLSLRLKIPLLGEIPLDLELRACSERGEAIAVEHPDSAIAEVLRRVTKNLIEKLVS